MATTWYCFCWCLWMRLFFAACRNVEKGEQVATELRKANAAANLAVMRCDLSSFSSVRHFVEEFKVIQTNIFAQHQQFYCADYNYRCWWLFSLYSFSLYYFINKLINQSRVLSRIHLILHSFPFTWRFYLICNWRRLTPNWTFWWTMPVWWRFPATKREKMASKCRWQSTILDTSSSQPLSSNVSKTRNPRALWMSLLLLIKGVEIHRGKYCDVFLYSIVFVYIR